MRISNSGNIDKKINEKLILRKENKRRKRQKYRKEKGLGVQPKNDNKWKELSVQTINKKLENLKEEGLYSKN